MRTSTTVMWKTLTREDDDTVEIKKGTPTWWLYKNSLLQSAIIDYINNI